MTWEPWVPYSLLFSFPPPCSAARRPSGRGALRQRAHIVAAAVPPRAAARAAATPAEAAVLGPPPACDRWRCDRRARQTPHHTQGLLTNARKVTVSVLYWYEELPEKSGNFWKEIFGSFFFFCLGGGGVALRGA